VSIWNAIIPAAASLVGGLFDKKSAESQADQNTALQREFAQSGVQWKVEDAKKAGVHPLYALGAQTHSFSPNAVFTNAGSTMAEMGQNLTRAYKASQPQDENNISKLQEELVRAQIAKTNAETSVILDGNRSTDTINLPLMGSYQGAPIQRFDLPEGQVPLQSPSGKQQGHFVYKPDEITSRRPDSPHVTAGTEQPFFKEFRMSNNRPALLPKTFEDDAEIPVMLWPSIIKENVQRYGLLNTIRAFGGGEGSTDDPVSQAIIRAINSKPTRSGRGYPTRSQK